MNSKEYFNYLYTEARRNKLKEELANQAEEKKEARAKRIKCLKRCKALKDMIGARGAEYAAFNTCKIRM